MNDTTLIEVSGDPVDATEPTNKSAHELESQYVKELVASWKDNKHRHRCQGCNKWVDNAALFCSAACLAAAAVPKGVGK